ncbi:methylmalonyl Co-A mutase-associated GTPase MeaB [Microvirga sp. W0021]|uniref:Methylmalonyl Co-A mutase-associated GTPase MeaB n=1 Tax=Hohaiivirga grylli TaxID=3133970 RepID=A0ABV0BGB0_9HYPH
MTKTSAQQNTAPRRLPSADDILQGNRAALARAITLVESRRSDHRQEAQTLLRQLMPHTGKAIRVGVTGVPGVGKSTTINSLGAMLTEKGHKVAVLAVDPSSTHSGGAILGDKTRMDRLATNDNAFIRPSPSAGTLGGVAAKTREAMLLCEAAGYDVILIETVGVGQSETSVANLTDFFLVLMLAGAGDELQGIKKGIIELADMIAVNKADEKGNQDAAAAEYRSALRILSPASTQWKPPVVTISGLTGAGLEELWHHIEKHHEIMTAAGELSTKRQKQDIRWMWAMVEERIQERIAENIAAKERIPDIENALTSGQISPMAGAEEIFKLLNI